VGTKAQLDFLAQRGCHAFQGFWVSRPLPVDAFQVFCRARTDAAAAVGAA
jgi:EAL domain-containing protein (putative c-di-GMP-specific phosphodiesterase class I)